VAGRIRIGCSGWVYRDWRGVLYPPRLPQARWLERYAEVFDTVEVNSTFYRLARPEVVERWVAATPPGFLFTVKASQYLTHFSRLRDLDRGVDRFYAGIAPLVGSPKLGPVLWQLPGRQERDDRMLLGRLNAPAVRAARLRVPPPELVRPGDPRPPARARRRPRDRRPPRAPLAAAHRHRAREPRAPALRRAGTARELLRHRARRVGRPHRGPRRGGRRPRLPQQRLGGLRRAQRAAAAAAARGDARPRHGRRLHARARALPH
jgi:uncharacterized protein YecE (DUF72 family)